MVRVGLTLGVFTALAAWAGAQGPPLTAADQIRLLRANRGLIADLVDSGVRLGAAEHPLSRAEACQATAHHLAVALERAAEGQDADRVAELGAHLELVFRDGLVPNLDRAEKIIPRESPDAEKLKEVRKRAAGDLDGVRAALPPGKLDGLRGKLDELREKLK